MNIHIRAKYRTQNAAVVGNSSTRSRSESLACRKQTGIKSVSKEPQ